MGLFNRRSKGDRIIDMAHSLIAGCEMTAEHSFTDEAKAKALAELAAAQDFLRRAVETKRVWDAVEHDDYEEYPNVPVLVNDQTDLFEGE